MVSPTQLCWRYHSFPLSHRVNVLVTSHYSSQRWLRSIGIHRATRPQWVKIMYAYQKQKSPLAAIPLKSIPMSRHLPEMPAECQTDFALTSRWHCAGFNCLFLRPWWRHSQRVLWSTRYKIRKQNTEYFTDTIVTMWVAKDVVDADILVNNGCRVL